MSGDSLKDKLAELKELLSEGLISQEEFARQKGLLLERWRADGAGAAVPPPPREAPPPYPPGTDPEQIPTYLAHPWKAYWEEPHPVIRIHRLTDLAEFLLRWTVALVLSEVRRANGGQIPRAAAARIAEHIERPTLGRWLGILRTLGEAAPREPLLVPGAFRLYPEVLEPAFGSERDDAGEVAEASSLLALRNRLAHGGGVSRAAASRLLEAHGDRVSRMMASVLAATRGVDVLVRWGEAVLRLRGPRPSPVPRPPFLPADFAGPCLVGTQAWLPLWPLAAFDRVRRPAAEGRQVESGPEPAAQVYFRCESRRLRFIPLGREEPYSEQLDLEAFRQLFRLGEEERGLPAHDAARASPEDFLREARVQAEDFIGRFEDRRRLKAWVKAADPGAGTGARIGWVAGSPGMGKSMLVSTLVSDLSNDPRRYRLFFHRFRAGDYRNSRLCFLQRLQTFLSNWGELCEAGRLSPQSPEGRELLDDVRERMAGLPSLPGAEAGRPAPRFLGIVDGLDEIAALDPGFPFALKGLALPGTRWVLAGRPERGLDKTFAGPGCEAIFGSEGLPPMSPDDIRAMLLEGLGNARFALLGRDQEAAGAVTNAFVSRVGELAEGLPLYVHLLLEDLRSGRFSVAEESGLPRGLTAFYDDLLGRMGLSTVRRDLPLVVCLLARAAEPLDVESLAALLAGRVSRAGPFVRRVENAIEAGRALFRTAPTRDGTEGWTLYHDSFRNYVLGREGNEGTLPPPALKDLLEEAEGLLVASAKGWKDLPPGSFRNHLFRWGGSYEMRWGGEEGLRAVRDRLRDFGYLQARTAALPSADVPGLVSESSAVLSRLPRAEAEEFRIWESFFRENANVLERGTESWPANRILLQLAVEHGDDSPVSKAAGEWLESGACDWPWFRNPVRPAHAAPSPCVRTIDLEEWGEFFLALPGARFLHGGERLSLWDADTGRLLRRFEGHTEFVRGAFLLSDGRLASHAADSTVRIWDFDSGACLAVLLGHSREVGGALELPFRQLVSWSEDGTLRIWDLAALECVSVLQGHAGPVRGALALPGDRLVSYSDDGTLRLWNLVDNTCVRTWTAGETGVKGVVPLADGRVVSWSNDERLYVWREDSPTPEVLRTGLRPPVDSVFLADPDTLIAVSSTDAITAWHVPSRVCVHVDRQGVMCKAYRLKNGLLATFSSASPSVYVWDPKGYFLRATLSGHEELVTDALVLDGDRLLTWSSDSTLRVWDVLRGACTNVIRFSSSHAVRMADLGNNRIASFDPYSRVNSVKVWDLSVSSRQGRVAPKHRGSPETCRLQGERVLSFSRFDRQVLVWNSETGDGSKIRDLESDSIQEFIPMGGVGGASRLSWARDGSLAVWDAASGEVTRSRRIEDLSPIADVKPLPTGDVVAICAHGDDIAVLDPQSLSVKGYVSREVRKEDDLRFLCLGAKRYRRLTVLSQRRILSTSSEILHLDGGMPTDRTRVENSLTLWAIPEGRRLADIARVLDKDDSPAAILSEGGFVTFHEDGPMRVWDPETGLCTAVLEGHGEAAGSALELPGKRILTWSRDGAIRTWDLGSGACGMVLDGHQGEVQGARLIGERRLVSWSKDRTLRVWDLKSGRATAVLESFTADVQGAHGFDDGTVIAWEGNGMYRSWNAETSRGLESLDENECVRLHPDWILARLQSEDRGLSAQSGFVSWKPGMRPGSSALGVLFVGGGSGFEALWHGESWVRRKSVSPDGTLIACTEEGHVFFPKLFWGARRVSLGEAQDIALRRRGGLPSPPGPR